MVPALIVSCRLARVGSRSLCWNVITSTGSNSIPNVASGGSIDGLPFPAANPKLPTIGVLCYACVRCRHCLSPDGLGNLSQTGT